MQGFTVFRTVSDITGNGIVSIYPDGTTRIVATEKPIFRESGWERAGECDTVPRSKKVRDADSSPSARAVHRAVSSIRDIVLCNSWDWWVTLTIAPDSMDEGWRYDYDAQQKKIRILLDNMVRRKGLRYILIPELHQDGAIHYHGFFGGGIKAKWSGTMQSPSGGKPVRVKSVDRKRLVAEGWREVYNLPDWTLGFSTAIAPYGDRLGAARYACKYATKMLSEGKKIGGRYYLSGGELCREPEKHIIQIDTTGLVEKGFWCGDMDFGGGRIFAKWTGVNSDETLTI